MNALQLLIPVFCLLIYTPNLWAQEIAGERPDQQTVDDAAGGFHDLQLDLELHDSFAVFYAGEIFLDYKQSPHLSGVFGFTGFRAVKLDKARNEKIERYWGVQDAVLDGIFSPNSICYDELLVGNERWYSFGRHPVRKYDEKEKGRPFSYILPVIEPRASIFCFAAGMQRNTSTKLDKLRFLRSQNIVFAKDFGTEIKCVVEYPGGSWYHTTLDKSQGNRPTAVAVTAAGQELARDNANARHVNRMRWKKSEDDVWLPEAGMNTNYSRHTKQSYQDLIQVRYRCVWRLGDDVPQSAFDRDDVFSDPGLRISKADEWIEQLRKVQPVDVD